jgi:hypothetical protein
VIDIFWRFDNLEKISTSRYKYSLSPTISKTVVRVFDPPLLLIRTAKIMPGGAVLDAVHGTADVERTEAPVTVKTYLICAFAAFGGIFFGYDTGWMGGVLGMPYFISQYTDNKLYPGITADNIPSNFAIAASNKSLMTSILSAGTFFGALVAVSLQTEQCILMAC